MLSHHDAFAIAKQRQVEFEADAAARRLVRAPEKAVGRSARGTGSGLFVAGRRRWRLFGRVRPA
ncbi:hypothetical protein LX90_008007 [Lentzea flava]|nr:hypothetical protein [Lentzea flava]